MICEVINRTVDHLGIIHSWRRADLLYEFVPGFTLSVCPIINAHERAPSAMLLFQVWDKDVGVELFAVSYFYLVSCQTILVILQ